MSDNYDEGKAAYDARDYETAFTILKPLAEQGHAEAQYNLGIMYEFGQGIEQDSKEADKWFYMAAEQRHTDAQYKLGLIYGLCEDL